jgi:Holliday junction resolvase RusA-like endonuclease
MRSRIENAAAEARGVTETDQLGGKVDRENSLTHVPAQPVTVTISGEPVAKGRARMTRRGFAYTPAATRKFEAHGRLAAQVTMDGRPPIEAPVHISVLVELPTPSSWSARKKAAALTGGIRPTSRPDVDNYVKAVLDALNGIVLADDALVLELRAIKQYGAVPQMVATITPIANAAASNRRPAS